MEESTVRHEQVVTDLNFAGQVQQQLANLRMSYKELITRVGEEISPADNACFDMLSGRLNKIIKSFPEV